MSRVQTQPNHHVIMPKRALERRTFIPIPCDGRLLVKDFNPDLDFLCEREQ